MMERAAIAAGLGIKAHAHMLRYVRGYKLANDGHDIATSRTPHGRPRWRRIGSRAFGAIDRRPTRSHQLRQH
jgi:hypothetical protein